MKRFYINNRIFTFNDVKDYAVAVRIITQAGAYFMLGYSEFRIDINSLVTPEISLGRVRSVIAEMADDGIITKLTQGNKHKTSLYRIVQPTDDEIKHNSLFMDWSESPLIRGYDE